jgi:transcriptional regulator with XRE-family HTH domain
VSAGLDLRTRRVELRMTARGLADELGVHPSTLLRWERGERLPGPADVTGLARSLRADRSAVVGFFDARRPPAPAATRLRATGLRALRRRRGWTAAHVAGRLGVPVPTVFNWEAGRAGMPLDLLPRLAAMAGLEGDDLRAVLAVRAVPAPTRRSPLQHARVRRGWSQADLAHAVGVSRHLVGSWERGHAPRLAQQRRLARALGLEVAVVAGWYAAAVPVGLRPGSWRSGDLPTVLRDLRAWSGLRQCDVAAHCGRSVAAVRAWEAGRSVPPPVLRRRLGQLFRLPDGALEAAVPTDPGAPGGTP